MTVYPQGTINERCLANMRENVTKDVEWFAGLPEHRGKLVIVAGGPSLRNCYRAIKARQNANEVIVACNGAHRVLRKNGITPDFVACVDPSEAVCGFFDNEADSSIYLISSSCHPSVFDKLSNRTVVMWHGDNGLPEQRTILDKYPNKPSALIGGGSTIALRMLTLGYAMGFRRFHLYGVDSSYAPDGADHAYAKHDGPEPVCGPLERDGKQYIVAPWMVKQAEDFVFWYAKLRGMGCKVHVHGEGLIPDMARVMIETVRERIAA